MKEAFFYQKLADNNVKCALCNHRCIIHDGQKGICGVRENQGGILQSLVYGRCISQATDPIEKKPLYHFYPGSRSFSVATVGCNFRCTNCQNYSISQLVRDHGKIVGDVVLPYEVVKSAKQYQCNSISYTYTEPTIFYEYAYDIAVVAHEQGLNNIFVTNGYITPEALQLIHPYLDAANVDLKSFSDTFYKKICGAHLEPVLESIRLYKELGIWLEITTLIIPTYNDSDKELENIADFIFHLDANIPWHISAYYPTYKLNDQPRTSINILKKAREIGLKAGLRYVYEGNVSDAIGENTYCYSCGGLLIERRGFTIVRYTVKGGKCSACQAPIDGIGLP
jgi:pyruvate formate lyase activating enzyme